jgi:1-acyl-sn-glycerol-3-phosphate acyltransferase
MPEVQAPERSLRLPKQVVELSQSLGRTGVLTRWAESTQRELAGEAQQYDPAFMQRIVPLMETFAKYFAAEVRGIENIPRGPVLLVGNHSGGALTPDTSALYSAWYRARGFDEPLMGLAFDAMFGIPRVRELMRKIGQMPASMKNAQAALASGRSVLVYPGGSYEVFRPFKERNRIVFNGRKGFIKLALRTGVPIVPVVGHGGHESLMVLSRGEQIAKLVGADVVRSDVWPIVLQFPWGLSTPAMLGVPLPAKITMQVCAPLDFSRFGPDAADDAALVERCYGEVVDGMQATLAGLARENPHPLRSRLRSLVGL